MELQTMQAQRAPPAPLVRGASHLPGPQTVQGRAALAGGRGQREGGAWQSKGLEEVVLTCRSAPAAPGG